MTPDLTIEIPIADGVIGMVSGGQHHTGAAAACRGGGRSTAKATTLDLDWRWTVADTAGLGDRAGGM